MPDRPLNNDDDCSIKIVFTEAMIFKTSTSNSYECGYLYIIWGKEEEPRHFVDSNTDGVVPWVAHTGKGSGILLSGVEKTSRRRKVVPIELLHNIIVTAHRNADESGIEAAPEDTEHTPSIDEKDTDSEVDSGAVRSLLTQIRKLFS